MTHPTSQVFELLQGLWAAHVVSAVARLGIPDLVAGGPKDAADLARETGMDARNLHRLLRTAASIGVLAEDGSHRFSQTPLSDVLRSDAAPGIRGIASFFTDEWHLRSWSRLLDTVRTGQPAIDSVYGMSFFEYLSAHRSEAATFFQGMTDFSSMEGPAVAAAYEFSRFERICDAGGGLGLLLALILNRNPSVQGVLFDRPDVIANAREQSFFEGLAGRVEFAEGDMFEAVPEGMDAYLLKRIMHDWPDAECGRILRNCRRAVRPGGKLLVVEQVILPGADSKAAKFMDLEMMLLLGGQEREEQDFRKMFEDSGWKLARIVPTDSAMYILEGDSA